MKLKILSLSAVGMLLALPSGAFACDFYLNSVFNRIPSGLSLGAGIQIQPGDGTVMIPSVDLGFGIGSRLGLFPAVGLCRADAEVPGEEDLSEVTFGGTAALNIFSGDKIALNAQAGLARVSLGDDVSTTTIPILGALQFMASPSVGLYGGAGMQMAKFSTPLGDVSDDNPIVILGLNIALSRLTLTGGVQLLMGEDETDTSVNIALRLPLGGG